jgi:hypothetical protein
MPMARQSRVALAPTTHPATARCRQVGYSLAYEVLLLGSAARPVRAVESAAPGVRVEDAPGADDPRDGSGPAGDDFVLVAGGGAAGGSADVYSKRVSLSEEVADPSRDFTLLIEVAPLAPPSLSAKTKTPDGFGYATLQQCERKAVPGSATGAELDKDASGKKAAESGSDSTTVTKTVAMATFVPAAMPAADASGTLPLEVIMIIDCSGSMGGTPIEQARDAALFLIKDLPVGRGLRFNVVAFGSSHVCWSAGGCREFTAATMADACGWVQRTINADLGGTEILETFRAVYSMPSPDGYTRQIIFLTGELPCHSTFHAEHVCDILLSQMTAAVRYCFILANAVLYLQPYSLLCLAPPQMAASPAARSRPCSTWCPQAASTARPRATGWAPPSRA